MNKILNFQTAKLLIIAILLLNKVLLSADAVEVLSLKGLNGVAVIVGANFNEYCNQKGLTEKTIQTDAELRLRLAGIKVYSPYTKDHLSQPGQQILYINIGTLNSEATQCYIYTIRTSLNQDVLLVRNIQTIKAVPTWVTGCYGIVHFTDIENTIRNTTKDQIDEFVNDYLSVNPK